MNLKKLYFDAVNLFKEIFVSPKETLNKLFIKKCDDSFIQFFRYTFVGGFAFIVDMGLFSSLTRFAGIHYLISGPIAFLAGLTINYILSTLWVFSQRSYKNKSAEIIIFATVGLIGLGFNELFLWIFTGLIGLEPEISKLISTVFVYIWNFSARKILLFSESE
mgnify:CR=1 FL=1